MAVHVAGPLDGATWTLEVRWIRRGRIPQAMFGWLGPFDRWIEQREDRYLVEPAVPELGVKLKGGVELDVKTFRGTPGELTIPGGGLGRLELWIKWRFPLEAIALPSPNGAGWLAVRKVRRRRSFGLVDGRPVERPVTEAEQPGCSVELTELSVSGEPWWTLCLEANGEPDALAATLGATAETVFRDPMPEGLAMDLAESMSYPEWFSARRA